jgi:hypothetical protein
LEPFSPQQDFALVITNAVLDEVTSPTEVAVIVDDDADGDPKSDEPDDFWDNEMKVDGDDDLLNGDWWDEIDEDEGLEENQGDSEENDVWWWLDSLTEAGDGNSAPRTEAEIPRERLIERESIKRALQSAAEQLGELDSILLPQSQVVTEAGAIPELLRFGSGADADVFNSSEHKLSKALAALMAAWHNFGHAGTRRRVAILVVGRGTRITSADVDALRRLAFHGNLYLLSDSHDLLIFLAQRIHLRRGIHFRFAAETDQLAAILNTTLVQAVGWRAVITNNLPIEEEEILRRTYRFYVTTLDHRIRIVIEHGEAKINRIRIKPPDHDPFTVTPATNRRFTTMIEDAGVKRIVLDVPDDIDRPWAGAWDLQIEQPLAWIFTNQDSLRIFAFASNSKS